MPLEGHYARTQTPLRALGRRELRLVWTMVAVVAVAAVLGLIAVLVQPAEHAAPGCVDAMVPGIMGGGHVGACGDKRKAFCDAQLGRTDNYARPILAACRKGGVLPPA